jgi:hypothetical protein
MSIIVRKLILQNLWGTGNFLFFLIIAFIYSSVGFGGGSSYLAVGNVQLSLSGNTFNGTYL